MRTNSNLLDLVARAGALLTIMSSVLIAVVLVGLPGATPAAPTSPQPTAVVASVRHVPPVTLLPEGAIAATTPMVSVRGPVTEDGQRGTVRIPEESPDGGYPLPYSAWLDNSPLYSDGWLLLVDDMQHVVRWRKTTDQVIADHEPRELTAVQTVAHHRKAPGKPHHRARCTAGKVRAEDGSCVPREFYRHAPITGASQAICDFLHKRRVPDARYGHVCV